MCSSALAAAVRAGAGLRHPAGAPVSLPGFFGVFSLLLFWIVFLIWLGAELMFAYLTDNCILVSALNYPRINTLAGEMKGLLGVRKDLSVFVYEHGQFNAAMVRVFRRRAIFLNSEILEAGVSDDEVRWLIGRFVGYWRSQQDAGIAGWMIRMAQKFGLLNFFIKPYERAMVYTGDRLGLAGIGGDIGTAIAAMQKLLVGRQLGYSVNPVGVAEQRRLTKGSLFGFLSRISSGHPPHDRALCRSHRLRPAPLSRSVRPLRSRLSRAASRSGRTQRRAHIGRFARQGLWFSAALVCGRRRHCAGLGIFHQHGVRCHQPLAAERHHVEFAPGFHAARRLRHAQRNAGCHAWRYHATDATECSSGTGGAARATGRTTSGARRSSCAAQLVRRPCHQRRGLRTTTHRRGLCARLSRCGQGEWHLGFGDSALHRERRSDPLVDCQVTDETPPGSGFGRAALDLIDQVKLSPQARDGTPVAGGTLTLRVPFAP